MRRFATSAAVMIAVGACATACGGSPAVIASGQEALPARSAQDWVTYGDAALLVRVVAEHRGQRSSPEADAGEGTIARTIDLSVDSVLWQRPGADERMPESMTWTTLGWTFHGDNERRMKMANQPDLAKGHQYVVAVVFRSENPDGSDVPHWIPLASEGIIAADDGTLGNGPDIVQKDAAAEGEEPPFRDTLWRKDVSAVGGILRGTEPDPAAAAWMSADPLERYSKAMATKGSPPSPAPGES